MIKFPLSASEPKGRSNTSHHNDYRHHHHHHPLWPKSMACNRKPPESLARTVQIAGSIAGKKERKDYQNSMPMKHAARFPCGGPKQSVTEIVWRVAKICDTHPLSFTPTYLVNGMYRPDFTPGAFGKNESDWFNAPCTMELFHAE